MFDGTATADARQRLLDAAIRLLAEEGPEALQVRRIASEIGVSSMSVYSRFGGFPDMIEAVVAEGFRLIGRRFAMLQTTSDPVADLVALALAYHREASSNPHLIDLMFGLSTPGGRTARSARAPSSGSGTAFDEAYRPLVIRATRAVNAKRFRPCDPEVVAAQLWSSVHGFVILDIGGYFAPFEDTIEEVFKPLATNVLIGLGDEETRAANSVANAVSHCYPSGKTLGL